VRLRLTILKALDQPDILGGEFWIANIDPGVNYRSCYRPATPATPLTALVAISDASCVPTLRERGGP